MASPHSSEGCTSHRDHARLLKHDPQSNFRLKWQNQIIKKEAWNTPRLTALKVLGTTQLQEAGSIQPNARESPVWLGKEAVHQRVANFH